MHPKLFTIPLLFTIPKAFGIGPFPIGPITIYTYGVLIAIAFLVGLWIVGRQAKRAGLDGARVTDLAVYALIAGLIGAKLMLLAVDWRTYSAHPRELFSLLQSAGVFYGGFLLALVLSIWYIRRAGLPFWDTLDVLAPGVAIAQAIGRLGCLMAGCCYGTVCDRAWAITFRDPWSRIKLGTPVDVPLHPTQIYESLAMVVIFLALVWTAPRKKFHGQIAATYVAAYGVARFVIEFFRGDTVRGTFLGTRLSTSQGFALIAVLAVAALVPYLRKRASVTPAA